jgi:hypothetical protein
LVCAAAHAAGAAAASADRHAAAGVCACRCVLDRALCVSESVLGIFDDSPMTHRGFSGMQGVTRAHGTAVRCRTSPASVPLQFLAMRCTYLGHTPALPLPVRNVLPLVRTLLACELCPVLLCVLCHCRHYVLIFGYATPHHTTPNAPASPLLVLCRCRCPRSR